MRNSHLILGILLTISLTPLAVSKPAAPKYSQKQIAEGKLLFKKLECASCHSVDDKGGCLAPQLDGVMQKRSEQYVNLRLSSAPGDEDKFIKQIGHKELVPHPRFPKAQVKNLIAYLSTLKSK